MIARLGTSAAHRQGAPRAQRTQLPLEKVGVGDRWWRAVENKWGKETIRMLSIGADVCRTAGNDLLAFRTDRETEVSEPGTDLAEPCKAFSHPKPFSPPSQKYPHVNHCSPTSQKLEPWGWARYSQLPCSFLPALIYPPTMASSANVFLSLPPGWLLPPPHLASDPRLATVIKASAVPVSGCGGALSPLG